MGDMCIILIILSQRKSERERQDCWRGRQRHTIACEMKRSTPGLLVRMLLSAGCKSLCGIMGDITGQSVTRTSLSGKEIDKCRSELR